ncbi:nicotinamide riboside transporter PnuC [Legionella sp.]|uniref:nicotinamide riboside transporter PnuC n=1 Tax=Legionella sp. TaxID=459 RepID=UPI00322092DF
MLLDILGAIISLLSTYYFIRLDSKAWLTSLFATCLNAFLYWQKGIYADMILESFYFFSTCYGWYVWQNPTPQRENIRSLSKKHWYLLLVLLPSCFLLISTLLVMFTRSDVIILDALTTSLSLAAQWLMCYKAIATWIFWFFTDVIYAYMYLHKQLPFHCLLMLVYMGMAAIGYLTWWRRNPVKLSNNGDWALVQPK